MSSDIQRVMNAVQRQLLDNMTTTINPRIIAVDPAAPGEDFTCINVDIQEMARKMALPLDRMNSPPAMPERMTATEMKLRQEEASRVLNQKAFIPELWSNKLVDEWAKNSIFGELVAPPLVGPDWPQYAGVEENKCIVADIDGRRMVSPRSDHMHDAILYGTSVIKLHATA